MLDPPLYEQNANLPLKLVCRWPQHTVTVLCGARAQLAKLAWSLLQVAREAFVTKEALRLRVLKDSLHVWNEFRLTTSSRERASGVE